MGVGFIVTIIFLACLLGVFSRQALAATEEQSSLEMQSLEKPSLEKHENKENASHQDAM